MWIIILLNFEFEIYKMSKDLQLKSKNGSMQDSPTITDKKSSLGTASPTKSNGGLRSAT